MTRRNVYIALFIVNWAVIVGEILQTNRSFLIILAALLSVIALGYLLRDREFFPSWKISKMKKAQYLSALTMINSVYAVIALLLQFLLSARAFKLVLNPLSWAWLLVLVLAAYSINERKEKK